MKSTIKNIEITEKIIRDKASYLLEKWKHTKRSSDRATQTINHIFKIRDDVDDLTNVQRYFPNYLKGFLETQALRYSNFQKEHLSDKKFEVQDLLNHFYSSLEQIDEKTESKPLDSITDKELWEELYRRVTNNSAENAKWCASNYSKDSFCFLTRKWVNANIE